MEYLLGCHYLVVLGPLNDLQTEELLILGI